MKKQSGFGLVEGLLIILIIAVVGFGSYYVWDSNRDDMDGKTPTEQTSQSAEELSMPAEESVEQTDESGQEFSAVTVNKSLTVESESNGGAFRTSHTLNIQSAQVYEDNVTLTMEITNNSEDDSGQGLDLVEYYHDDFEVVTKNAVKNPAVTRDGQPWNSETLPPGGSTIISLSIPSIRISEDPMMTINWSPGGNVYGSDSIELNLR